MQWINTTVGDFCSFVYGKAIKKQDQLERGVPVYGSNGIYTYSASQLVGPYSVIIGRKGSVGKLHISFKPCWVSDTAFYVKYESLEDAYFTYYLLSTLGLEDMNTDAAVPGLNRDNAHRLEVRIPESVADRKKLIEPLIVLDEKIQLNQQINQTLEQMAQAIFKSWFVDFEPIKAKIAALEAGGSEDDALLAAMQVISGKDPQQLTQLQTENPEDYTTLRATAELFPAAMQESELGEIPEGWTVSDFSKIARLDTISVNPGQEPEKIWEHYSIPAFDKNCSPAHELGSEIKSGKYKVHPASILSSKLNPHFPRTWIPNVSDQDAAICSTEFMQFVPNKKTHRPFVAGLITSRPFQAGIMMRVTGSTGSRQRAQPREVAVMEIVLPPAELIDVYSTIASPILKNAAKNISQIITLAELRDTLLPKLLSGELSVNQDAD